MACNSDPPASPEIIEIEDEESDRDAGNEGRMQCIFTWRIKNFSCSRLECGEELYSPIFSADSSAKTRWYLSVFPNGQIGYEEFVSVHLIRLSIENKLCAAKLNCKMSVIDDESEVWHSESTEQAFGVFGRFEYNSFIRKDKLIQEKEKILIDDTLTISCQICAYDETLIPSQLSTEAENSHYPPLKKLSKDFKAIYESGKFSNVTLKLEDGSIFVHKTILSARSVVFSQLLRDSYIIQIPKFKKKTMEALLNYVYSGETDITSATTSLELYEAAEKYNIRELKRSISPSKIFARTEILKEKFSFTWRLKNFSLINRSLGRMIYSDKFHTGPSCRLWTLSLYFNNSQNSSEEDENIGIYLNKLWTTDEKKLVYVHFKLYLLDKEEQPRHVVETEKCYKQSNRYGFSSFIKRRVLLGEASDLLPGDILTVRCDMKVCDGTYNSTIVHSLSSTNTNHLDMSDVKNLSDCFKELFLGKRNSDVTVCSANKKFFLHKIVLCARSPVFSTFFQNLTSDINPYTIDISGIKPKILELLFVFLYTGTLENLSCETAPDLYAAANHYKITDLKQLCCAYLKSNITPGNAFEIMALCKIVNDDNLKGLAKDFICSHAEEMLIADPWRNFMKDHADFSDEILKSLSEGYRESKRRRLM